MSASFGQRFKMLRLEKGLKQEELINDFNSKYHYNFTKSAVSQYENDKRIPEIDALNSFASYFETSVDFLLGRSDIQNDKDSSQNALENAAELLYHSIDKNSKEDLSNMVAAVLIKRLIEEKIIDSDGNIDDKTMELIKQAIKIDAKLSNNIKKDAED